MLFGLYVVGFFLRLRLAYFQYNWVFFKIDIMIISFVLWQIKILILFVETAPRITNRASYRLYSTCISRLFSKTFSRRIRWTWGRFSPRHLAKSGRGLYFPVYNLKTASTKSNYFISTGSTTFYLFYIYHWIGVKQELRQNLHTQIIVFRL